MRGSQLRSFLIVVVGIWFVVAGGRVALAQEPTKGSEKTATATQDDIDPEVADVKNDPLPTGDFELQTALGDAQKKIETLEVERKALKEKVDELKPNYDRVKTFTERLDGLKRPLEGSLQTIADLDCKGDKDGTALKAATRALSEALVNLKESPRLASAATRYWLFVDPDLSVDTPENGNPITETCAQYKKRIAESKSSLLKAFDEYRREADTVFSNYNQKQDELTKTDRLITAWREKKFRISKGIQKLRDSDRSGVNAQLPLLIAILGVFSLSIMVMVRRFSQDIQREWVVSGQVIQFMTVTIIISAVIALGLAGILEKEILGTLLGAIGGYVLSQGVGRAVTSKIDNVEQQMAAFLKAVSQARPPNGDGSSSQTNSATNTQANAGANTQANAAANTQANAGTNTQATAGTNTQPDAATNSQTNSGTSDGQPARTGETASSGTSKPGDKREGTS